MTNSGHTACLIFGTFNPLTIAHVNMSAIAKRTLPDADVIYIPAKNRFLRSWKGLDNRAILDDKIRLGLIREAFCGTDYVSVSSVEIDGLTDGRTYNTIRYFRDEKGYDDIYLCFGTDKVAELHTWYRGPEIIRENRFLILTRGQGLSEAMTEETAMYRDNFIEVPCDMPSVSATMVREACQKGELDRVKDFLPFNVYDYLKQNNAYAKNSKMG